MKSIILRFRDSDKYDTVKEHLSIIKQEGSSWWGWWKKDSEPDQYELLNASKSKPNEFNFYIFDRSKDKFYKCEVLDIVNSKSAIETPDKNLTPNYYNNYKLKAWFNISNINEIAKSDFLNSFKIIPNFDATLFTEESIRLELQNKSKRKKVKSDVILHLSDLHLGSDFGFPSKSVPNKRSLTEIIVDYVNNDLKQKIGLLIISGDITSRGDSSVLIDRGLPFLNAICENLKINKDNVIIIPGNHDIPLRDANFADYNHEATFKLFLEQFYGKKKDLYGIDLFEFPDGTKLDILRIHSVRLRKKEENNYGYVDWFLYKNILNSNNLDGDVKMAVIHHHLVATPIEETLDTSYPYGNISVTIDSGRVLEGLQRNGFSYVLNGHQHIPGITKVSRGIINDRNEIQNIDNHQVHILSAGSAGVKPERYSEEMKYNSFSIYKLSQKELDVEVKVYNPSIEPKRYFKSKIVH